MTASLIAKLRHPQLGLCELVRVEATDWIIRVQTNGNHYRVSPERRGQFEIVRESTEPTRPTRPKQRSQPQKDLSRRNDPTSRNARRVIESLRVGLPSLDGSTRQLAVGFTEMESLIKSFLHDIDSDGGGAMIMKGAYGQGKTFSLTMLEEMAQEQGFITVRTEIDATENQLNKPHHIYHDLMKHLRLPGSGSYGIRELASKTHDLIREEAPRNQPEREKWLETHLQCFPLAWLLSDPVFVTKEPLLGLLAGDPNVPARVGRQSHVALPPPNRWPAFTAATQGDFASFLISGIGRLARLLGYKGLLVIMDEMEKWNQLNWNEQCRAGNLLGGLIWGATAEEGHRNRYDNPKVIRHSGRCGGYPFTTISRNFVGVAIAMTPREHDNPEHLWSQYGPILVGEVQPFTERRLIQYCKLVMPLVAEAYSLSSPTTEELEEIASEASRLWRKQGDLTTRSGVQAAIAAFDNWRDWA
jgi:hypothetical protein